MQKKFQVRETGYYFCNEHFGHHDFFQPATLKDFSDKDAKTVNFAKHKIHGLAYQPCYRERPDKQDQADIVYCDCTTNTRQREGLSWLSKQVMLKKTCSTDDHSSSRFINLGLPQIETVKKNDCRTVSASCGFHLILLKLV